MNILNSESLFVVEVVLMKNFVQGTTAHSNISITLSGKHSGESTRLVNFMSQDAI